MIERDARANEEQAETDDLRPEYDFSKLRIVKRRLGNACEGSREGGC